MFWHGKTQENVDNKRDGQGQLLVAMLVNYVKIKGRISVVGICVNPSEVCKSSCQLENESELFDFIPSKKYFVDKYFTCITSSGCLVPLEAIIDAAATEVDPTGVWVPCLMYPLGALSTSVSVAKSIQIRSHGRWNHDGKDITEFFPLIPYILLSLHQEHIIFKHDSQDKWTFS